MTSPPRVALFTDSFHEANGVGTLTRELVAFAQRRGFPFCCVHGGNRTHATSEGPVLTLELKRSIASFPLDSDLYCDPLLSRHRNRTVQQVRAFQPDVIHITGPGDLGVLGFWVAHLLRIPLAASWHTNLHEYLYRRLYQWFSIAPQALQNGIAEAAQTESLRALTAFYRLAQFVLAPNAASADMLRKKTGRPCYLMAHGVDTERFSPDQRGGTDDTFCIGYVGRLTPEKGVRSFAELERSLLAAGQKDFRMLLVGEGSERAWLERTLRHGELPGILRGDNLAAAFAGMDAFVFPSRTDTFGLVMLEAMASGVPVVANPETGLRAGVEHKVSGLLTNNVTEGVLQLIHDPAARRQMACNARHFASTKGWDIVFEDLYRTYESALAREDVQSKKIPKSRFRKT